MYTTSKWVCYTDRENTAAIYREQGMNGYREALIAP
jgi:hypothetical protein